MAVTFYALPINLLSVLTAFFLFRFFDVLKIWPARSVDQWSKKLSSQGHKLWGGFGVMMDDVIAGAQGLLALSALRYLGFFDFI